MNNKTVTLEVDEVGDVEFTVWHEEKCSGIGGFDCAGSVGYDEGENYNRVMSVDWSIENYTGRENYLIQKVANDFEVFSTKIQDNED